VEGGTTMLNVMATMAVVPFALCSEVKDIDRMVHKSEPVNKDGS
jgi:hypothetical protein